MFLKLRRLLLLIAHQVDSSLGSHPNTHWLSPQHQRPHRWHLNFVQALILSNDCHVFFFSSGIVECSAVAEGISRGSLMTRSLFFSLIGVLFQTAPQGHFLHQSSSSLSFSITPYFRFLIIAIHCLKMWTMQNTGVDIGKHLDNHEKTRWLPCFISLQSVLF